MNLVELHNYVNAIHASQRTALIFLPVFWNLPFSFLLFQKARAFHLLIRLFASSLLHLFTGRISNLHLSRHRRPLSIIYVTRISHSYVYRKTQDSGSNFSISSKVTWPIFPSFFAKDDTSRMLAGSPSSDFTSNDLMAAGVNYLRIMYIILPRERERMSTLNS